MHKTNVQICAIRGRTYEFRGRVQSCLFPVVTKEVFFLHLNNLRKVDHRKPTNAYFNLLGAKNDEEHPFSPFARTQYLFPKSSYHPAPWLFSEYFSNT